MKLTRRHFSESGYILHKRPYGETSLLLDVFTYHKGRMSFIAKGARKSSHKRNTGLELFIHYDFSWIAGNSELYTLIGAESVMNRAYLFSPYQLCCGIYLNELLLRILHKEDSHPQLFKAYQVVLENIHAHHDFNNRLSVEQHLRIFEKTLLQELGYGFFFKNLQAKKYYIFKNVEGFIPVLEKTPESISGESLLALAHEQLKHEHLPEIKRLMRQALSILIGHKPLKSKELFL